MRTPSGFIAFCRWTSALLVVLGHARALNLVGFAQIERDRVWFAPYYLLSSLGMQAVMVFFVLSGYLVGGKAIERALDGRFRWQDYAVDRSTRIYGVLLPALVLTCLLDTSGQAFASATGFYDGSAPILAGRFDTPFRDGDGASTFFCNLLQGQPMHCPVLGSNIPLWSLSLEVWYYLAAGILGVTLQRRGVVPWALFVAAIGGVFAATGAMGLSLGAIWALGALIYLCRDKAFPTVMKSRTVGALVFAALLLLSTRVGGAMRWGPVDISLVQLLSGGGFAFLLNTYVQSSRDGFNAERQERLAAFSFSLYVVHFPLLVLTYALLTQWTDLAVGKAAGYQPTLRNLGAMLFAVALSIAVAKAFAICFEDGSYRLRRRIKAQAHLRRTHDRWFGPS